MIEPPREMMPVIRLAVIGMQRKQQHAGVDGEVMTPCSACSMRGVAEDLPGEGPSALPLTFSSAW